MRADPPMRTGPRAEEASASYGIELVRVAAGESRLRSTRLEVQLQENPAKQVRISGRSRLGRHDVTQAELEAVNGSNPSRSDERCLELAHRVSFRG